MKILEKFKIYNRRYLGSKYKLLEFIEKIVQEHTKKCKIFLDLFAGTGSISIELLSREAQYVVGLELDRDHCTFIRQCIDKLGADNYSLIRGDVFRYLKSCRETFDLIFADPPYALKNLEEIPQIVLDKDILSEDGIFVLEHGKHNHFEEHPCFLERRAYGSVNFSLFKAKPKE